MKRYGKSNEFNITTSYLFDENTFSICLAKAIADILILPSAKVDNLDYYFTLNNIDLVNSFLNTINNIFPIDHVWITKLTGDFYKQRYYSVFPNNVYFISNEENCLLDFFNIGLTVDKDTLSILKSEHEKLNFLLNNSKKLIEYLNNKSK